MATKVNTQWRLASRPSGDLKDTDLTWHEEPLKELRDGEILLRAIYLSINPTNRIWMSDMEQYLPPVEVGEIMRGGTLSVVEESRHGDFSPGDLVAGVTGWQRYFVSDGSNLNKLPGGVPVPLDAYMSVFSHIGATAYFGMLEVGQAKEGETVVVSAAAGAVGSLAGQIAKIQGCRVVGIAGSDAKCRWITEELGFDGAINYHTQDVAGALAEQCPDGIDVFFDSVGGPILDAALTHINLRARIPLCGLISSYNATEPVPGPYNYGHILMKRARVEGFIILDYIPRFPEAFAKLGEWMGQGKIRYKTDVVAGLDQAPNALRRLFSGANIGKTVVKVSDEPVSG